MGETHEGRDVARARWRKWVPTYLQFRLAVLMFAIVLGFSGMIRNDPRLIFGAMGFGAVGVVLRFVRPKGSQR